MGDLLLALAVSAAESIISSIVIVLSIAFVVFLVFKLGRFAVKLLVGIVVNSILGFVTILLLDYFLNIGIPFSLPVLISTALFGLPGVGTMVVFKLFGYAFAILALHA